MTETDLATYRGKIERLEQLIENCDAICVGAASGMSTASGFRHYYERDETFVRDFSDFEEKYGFHSTFDGFYHLYRSDEERMAFIAQMVCTILESDTGTTYDDIHRILDGRRFHILTTNQDAQFNRVYPEEKISAIQGDWRFLQCPRRCHDGLYPAEDVMAELRDATDSDLKVPSEMLPRCPRCGAVLEPWVRSRVFLEGKRYRNEYRKLNAFLEENRDGSILFLELGVGRMTPMFIQEPFWNLTYNLPRSFYATVNPRDALVPREIADRGLAIHEDIARVLSDIVHDGEVSS